VVVSNARRRLRSEASCRRCELTPPHALAAARYRPRCQSMARVLLGIVLCRCTAWSAISGIRRSSRSRRRSSVGSSGHPLRLAGRGRVVSHARAAEQAQAAQRGSPRGLPEASCGCGCGCDCGCGCCCCCGGGGSRAVAEKAAAEKARRRRLLGCCRKFRPRRRSGRWASRRRPLRRSARQWQSGCSGSPGRLRLQRQRRRRRSAGYPPVTPVAVAVEEGGGAAGGGGGGPEAEGGLRR
jgi:hypothetical protein